MRKNICNSSENVFFTFLIFWENRDHIFELLFDLCKIKSSHKSEAIFELTCATCSELPSDIFTLKFAQSLQFPNDSVGDYFKNYSLVNICLSQNMLIKWHVKKNSPYLFYYLFLIFSLTILGDNSHLYKETS